MQSSDELWAQDYQEIIDSIPDLIFDDYSPSPSPSPTPDKLKASCKGPTPDKPKASCKGPKSCIGRPIRRRSSSSKTTPTTLLKADTKNFRALVQQFTGCHSASPVLRAYKGPINLNFKQRSYYPAQQQQQMQVGYRVVHDHEYYQFDHNTFLPLGAKIEDVTTTSTTGVDGVFDPRAEALTYDHCDVDSFWLWGEDHDRVLSGSGDHYTAALSGAMNHEFWGY